MRLRILLEPHHGASYAQILALAQAAEAGGFDAFFRSDHYLGIDADDTDLPADRLVDHAGGPGRADRAGSGSARSSTRPPSGSPASSRSRSRPSPR